MPNAMKIEKTATKSNIEKVIFRNLDLIVSELTFHLGNEYDNNHLFWRSNRHMRNTLAIIFDSMPIDFRIATGQTAFVEYWIANKSTLEKKYLEEQLLDELS